MKIPAKSHAQHARRRLRHQDSQEPRARDQAARGQAARTRRPSNWPRSSAAEAERKAEEERARREAVEQERAAREAERAAARRGEGRRGSRGRGCEPPRPSASQCSRAWRTRSKARRSARPASAPRPRPVSARLPWPRRWPSSQRDGRARPCRRRGAAQPRALRQVGGPFRARGRFRAQEGRARAGRAQERVTTRFWPRSSSRESPSSSRSSSRAADTSGRGAGKGAKKHGKRHVEQYVPELEAQMQASSADDRYAQMAVQAEKLQRDKVLAEARAAVAAATAHEGRGAPQEAQGEARGRELASAWSWRPSRRGLDPTLVLDDSRRGDSPGCYGGPVRRAARRGRPTTSSSACSCWGRCSRSPSPCPTS